ncbi:MULTISPECIES: hypothetical protein [unclassified Curtobacterium]|uniref:hypothetical protein n=1 Tax=unclassified Curtobacterium TaxID=257496 RepID=UPI0015E8D564|nr:MULTISPECIES: hypothetical protein [unclassified Curtobacterium]WIB63107.1 hypothetical protein DEI94_13250 [Curtobacterium sp. MCBD17_040]WIB66958.1 hypothetical protein DEI93_13480 [Curtobacterium sp. MCBD17_035]WIE54098.1 hypothetical protein DEI88_013365 [Curtobacterium sp. MCBD17_003]
MPERDEVRRLPTDEWERLKRDARERAEHRLAAQRRGGSDSGQHTDGRQEP